MITYFILDKLEYYIIKEDDWNDIEFYEIPIIVFLFAFILPSMFLDILLLPLELIMGIIIKILKGE